VLEGDGDHPRKIFRCPELGEGVALAEAVRGPQGEMSLVITDRVIDIGMGVVSLREKHGGPQADGLSPKLGQDLALELDPLDVGGIGRDFNGRDDVVANEPDRFPFGRIDENFRGSAVQVARRDIPSLPFPLVIVQPERMSVRPLELCIYIDKSLDVIFPRSDFINALQGKAEHRFVDDGSLPRFEGLDVFSPDRDPRRRIITGLKPGFPASLLETMA